MNKFLILAALAVAANAIAPELLKKADEHTQFCSEDVGISYEDAKKLRFAVITDEDEKNQRFTKCFLERSDFMDGEGKFLTDIMYTKLGTSLDDDGKVKLRELIDKCTDITETDVVKRAFSVHNCYFSA